MSVVIDGTSGITLPDGNEIDGGFTAKAWVNFNGSGTLAIRNDGNVSSITDDGVGDYTVNFTDALADADYALAGWAKDSNNGGSYSIVSGNASDTLTSTSCEIRVRETTADIDPETGAVIFVR
jgi:hypothetical protein